MRVVSADQTFDGSVLMTVGESPALVLKIGRGGPSGTYDVAPSVTVFVLTAGGAYQKHGTYDLAHSEVVLDFGELDLGDIVSYRVRAGLV